MNVINFYRTRDLPYGVFSNFAKYPITIENKVWPTSEHYFQAQKFAGTPHEEEVRNAPSARDAADMGRDRSRPLRKDWEEVKEQVMQLAVTAKFTQYPELRKLLVETGDAKLVEHTVNDSYWGDGGDGSGKNRLGIILMNLRGNLR